MADALRQCSRILISGGHRFTTVWYGMPSRTSSSFYWICRSPLEQQFRCYSSQGRRGFLGGLLDDIKQELSKNKEMKENIKKFREEAKKFEESDALQQARRKFKSIESETMKTSEVFKKKFEEITDTVKESIDEVGKSDLGRKIREGVEEAAKTAKHSAESVSKGGEKLGKTTAFKVITQGVETVKKEIDESILAQTGPYRPPSRLRKRSEFSGEKMGEEKIFEPNEESLGVVVHKDSKWHQQWKEFKDNNVVFNKTPKHWTPEDLQISDVFIPPSDNTNTYSQLAHPIQQAKTMGLRFHSKVLDIDNIDLAMGKMMEQGPVLIITFQAQLVMVIKNQKGEVVEGDQDKVLRMLYVWALCRDQDELNPYAAWRLLDISSSASEQIL
ncbi:mitochondrial import inner membrane translocase subunit TIM44 [Rhinoderma darwinii]|uniref:mitochondrial import inner membrane translocase subunit TIM44 n=1 Tax=Rhinoderma darwinii TaxID=43563 RepID=UPI003F66EAD7